MKNTVSKNLLWIAVDKLGLLFLSFFSFTIYAIYLEPSELGKAVLFNSIPGLISLVFMSALEVPLIRHKNINNVQLSTVIWGAGTFSLFLYLLSGAVSYIFLTEIFDFYLFMFASLIIIFNLLSRPFVAKLRVQRDFKSIAKRTIYGKISGIIVGCYLAFSGFGELSVISQNVIEVVFSFVFLFFPYARSIKLKFDSRFMFIIVKEGAPMCVRSLSNSIIKNCIPISIGIFAGNSTLGYYNFANRIVSMISDALFNGSDGYALPVLASRANNEEKFNSMLLLLYHHLTVVVLPLFVGLFCLADIAIINLFGDKWLNSIYLIQLLCVITIIRIFYLLSTTSLIAHGQQREMSVVELVSSISTLIVSIVLLNFYGVESVLYALIGHYVFIGFFMKRVTKKLTNIKYFEFYNNIKIIVLSSALMAVFVVFMKQYIDGYLSLFLLPVLGALFYTSFIYVFEKESVTKFISTLTKK